MKKIVLFLAFILLWGCSFGENTIIGEDLSRLDAGKKISTDLEQYFQFDNITGSFDFEVKMKDEYSGIEFPDTIKVVKVDTGTNRMYVYWRTNQEPLLSQVINDGGADIRLFFYINGNQIYSTPYTLFGYEEGGVSYGGGNWNSLPALTHFGEIQNGGNNTGDNQTGSNNTGTNLTIGNGPTLSGFLFSTFWFYFDLFIFYMLLFPVILLFAFIFYVIIGQIWKGFN